MVFVFVFVLDMSSKAKEIKAKINKWHLIKLKSLCTAKEIMNKMKRQLTEWEKVFVNYWWRLTPKIYKQFIQLNIKKNDLKMGRKTWIDIFPKKAHRYQ